MPNGNPWGDVERQQDRMAANNKHLHIEIYSKQK